MARVGVILSGCGVFDGSEIHEAVSVLLALDRQGAEYRCLAPDTQLDEIDHVTQQPTGQKRSVLKESARIARGEVTDLAKVHGADFDAYILPGGFGAAKNLCTFAMHGAECRVDPEVDRVLREAHALCKPIGFACIAPALGAKVFGNKAPALTIGHDDGTARGLEAMGAVHVACGVRDSVVDEGKKFVSTPAYMEARRISEVYDGIDAMVERVLAMVGGRRLACGAMTGQARG